MNLTVDDEACRASQKRGSRVISAREPMPHRLNEMSPNKVVAQHRCQDCSVATVKELVDKSSLEEMTHALDE